MVEMDSSGIHLWLVLMKAYRTLARHARCSIEPLGLGPSDFAILELLLHKGQQPVNAIGRRVDLTSGAITSAVDRLEAQGLVVRTADAEDRRTRFVSLTPKGTARIREVFGAHKQAMEGVTEQPNEGGARNAHQPHQETWARRRGTAREGKQRVALNSALPLLLQRRNHDL
jgi:MarR family 2-MHQ and catechol resistance regulon transcriptional repressor